MIDEQNSTDTFQEDFRKSPGLLFPMPSEEDIKKNGLYYYVLSEQERVFYAMARHSEGLQDEIDLLKAKIQYIQFVLPANFALLLRALSLLERLQKTQRLVFKKDDSSRLERAVENVFKDLNIPLALMHDGLPDPPAAA